LRDADGLAGNAWDFVDRGFGRHDESDDIPAQNGDGLAVGGDHSIAAHDAEVRDVIFDRLGARRQIGDLDEFNADARMICLGDRSESRDEAIGRAAAATATSIVTAQTIFTFIIRAGSVSLNSFSDLKVECPPGFAICDSRLK